MAADAGSEQPQERKIQATLDGVSEKKKKEPVEREQNRVLVVEDSKPLRRMLEKLLLSDGYIVDTAEHGQEAVNILSAPECPKYNLMILDIMMPVLDGVQTMAYCRKNNINVPPVVICSSRSDMKTVQLVSKLGAIGYILKPFKTETVLTKVRKSIYSNMSSNGDPSANDGDTEAPPAEDAAETESGSPANQEAEAAPDADSPAEDPPSEEEAAEPDPPSTIREDSAADMS